MMKTSALSHLVEAATALSELNDSKSLSASSGEYHAKVAPSGGKAKHLQKSAPNKKSVKREIFPKQLMDILSDTSLSDVISWLPHGRSFVIIRPDIFTDTVLPKFLPPVDSRTSTKYPSFTRKLNRWGFRQATKGPDTGAFHHNFFCRDQPELCLKMVCQKSRDRQTRQRRSLPPKKRVVAGTSEKEEPIITQTPGSSISSFPCVPSSATANVSSDERSQASQSHSSSVGQSNDSASVTPSTVLVPSKESSNVMPYISNDPAFVRRTLQQRDKVEVLRAAKAMLYESYMKALVNKGR